jgi:hypothetical protein
MNRISGVNTVGNQYNVYEALRVLQEHFITSSIQMVARWIREGKLLGSRTENRKDGYLIDEDDLYRFIEERKPGMILHIENEKEKVENTPLPEKAQSKKVYSYKDIITERLAKQEKSIQLIMEKIDTLSHESSSIPPIAPQNIDLEVRMNQQEKSMQSLSEQFETLKTNLNESFAGMNKKSIDKLDQLLERFDQAQNSGTPPKKMAYVVNKNPDVKNQEKKEEVDDDRESCTWDDFQKMVNKHIPPEYTVDNEKMLQELRIYYDKLIKDNKVRKEHLTNGGKIRCPFTKKMKSSLHEFVGIAIPAYFIEHTSDNSLPPNTPAATSSDDIQEKVADESIHPK